MSEIPHIWFDLNFLASDKIGTPKFYFGDNLGLALSWIIVTIKQYYFDANSFGASHKSAALISKIALHNHYQGHLKEIFDYFLAKQA